VEDQARSIAGLREIARRPSNQIIAGVDQLRSVATNLFSLVWTTSENRFSTYYLCAHFAIRHIHTSSEHRADRIPMPIYMYHNDCCESSGGTA
jgi:hypothetical protein